MLLVPLVPLADPDVPEAPLPVLALSAPLMVVPEEPMPLEPRRSLPEPPPELPAPLAPPPWCQPQAPPEGPN